MAKSKSSMIIDAGNATNHAKETANKLNQNSKLDMFKSIVKVINNVERRNKNIRRMKINKPTNHRFG
jgi:hypothetical protein